MMKVCGRITWDQALLQYRFLLQKSDNGFIYGSDATRAKIARKTIKHKIDL